MTTPRIIEPLSQADIAADIRNATTGTLRETDPIYHHSDAIGGYAFAHRAQLNERLLGLLIDWAVGSDLDAKASEYSIARNTGETDAAFRVRIKATIDSAGAAGTDEAYLAVALANADVVSAAIYPNTTTDMIDLYINTATGLPSPTLVNAVQTAINTSPRKAILDRINVEAATANPIIYLIAQTIYPAGGSASDVSAQAEANRDALAAEVRQLGRTITLTEAQSYMSRGGLVVNILHFSTTAAGSPPTYTRSTSIAPTATPPESQGWTLSTTLSYAEDI